MKPWLWLLIVMLLGSVVANLFLGLWARGYYLELNDTRLDPMGLAFYADVTPPAKSGDKERLLFFGDSRAYSWPVPEGIARFEVINRGVGGQTTAQLLARFDQDVTRLQPDVVIIQAGINDLKAIGLFPERRNEIVATCKKNLAAMVQRTTAQGATVILTTVFPTAQPSPLRRPFWSDAVGAAI